ncbi:MAG TPA: FAD-dependent oxidoreductase [Gemmatimonadaceae bacterium]|jgi:ferredoxin-NADP reductase|nr:FAD-dependent oxidoreductase [Gemmatimonadaceae bacterium]
MSIYTSRLLRRASVAHETLACIVERPSGFSFRAGQYVDITLPDPPYDDLLGPTRSFSIASAPGERDLLLLMRLRNTAFKRAMTDMPLGSALLLDGPVDDLSLAINGGRSAVYLAGGVGVAPFLGAIRHAAAHGGELEATLFYSNRRPEDAAYLEELTALTERVRGFRFVPTMTKMELSEREWSGERARIGVPILQRYLPSLRGPRYYLAGSTLLISGVRQELARAGIPGGDIRAEMYAGY